MHIVEKTKFFLFKSPLKFTFLSLEFGLYTIFIHFI